MAKGNETGTRIMRSPLGRVRGLGAARSGVAHWWAQRISALALAPLGLWFVYSLLTLEGVGRAKLAHWVAAPVDTMLLLSLLIALFYHLDLGLRVVIEDYIHSEGPRVLVMLAMRAVAALAALAGVVAVLKLSFAP